MFFKKDKNISKTNELIKISALLIHAAKIDENYTSIEEEIIKKTLLKFNATEEDLSQIIEEAKKIEEDSIQILDFTKEVKNLSKQDKIRIIEAL